MDTVKMPTSTNGRFPPAFAEAREEASTLPALRSRAQHCRRCDLYQDATQVVFGEGPARARVILVGEQPGDREDIEGHPFVGPAGMMLNECLQEAGVDRQSCYVTNAVKHFKFERRGKRRIHAKPNAGEVQRCAWWLGAELDVLQPDLVVALGATALYSLMGRSVGLTKERGHVLQTQTGLPILITIHPSYLLRIREQEVRHRERQRFIEDLRLVHGFLDRPF